MKPIVSDRKLQLKKVLINGIVKHLETYSSDELLQRFTFAQERL